MRDALSLLQHASVRSWFILDRTQVYFVILYEQVYTLRAAV